MLWVHFKPKNSRLLVKHKDRVRTLKTELELANLVLGFWVIGFAIIAQDINMFKEATHFTVALLFPGILITSALKAVLFLWVDGPKFPFVSL